MEGMCLLLHLERTARSPESLNVKYLPPLNIEMPSILKQRQRCSRAWHNISFLARTCGPRHKIDVSPTGHGGSPTFQFLGYLRHFVPSKLAELSDDINLKDVEKDLAKK